MRDERMIRRARSITAQALLKGEIDNAHPCVVCLAPQASTPRGGKAVALHHPDYERPLYVIPLCRSCHGKVHAGVMAEPETGRMYPKPVRDPATVAAVRQRVLAGAAWRRRTLRAA
jgi:hypothetical protein